MAILVTSELSIWWVDYGHMLGESVSGKCRNLFCCKCSYHVTLLYHHNTFSNWNVEDVWPCALCCQVIGQRTLSMAMPSHFPKVSHQTLNISSQEVKSRRSNHTAATIRSLPSEYAQGSPRCRVHLRICRFSQGLRHDSKLGFSLISRTGHRKFNGSRGLGQRATRCVSGGSGDSLGGDPQLQQMLVEMVQIQIGKSRMSDFVDERSQHMRNIAQDTFDQHDRIAYRTMKGLDASGSRVSIFNSYFFRNLIAALWMNSVWLRKFDLSSLQLLLWLALWFEVALLISCLLVHTLV